MRKTIGWLMIIGLFAGLLIFIWIASGWPAAGLLIFIGIASVWPAVISSFVFTALITVWVLVAVRFMTD